MAKSISLFVLKLALLSMAAPVWSVATANAEERPSRFAPPADEQQLPFDMRSRMETLPRVAVGQSEGDLVGRDDRVLQAAVDYIAGLGGGTVVIGPGEYQMRDSLHLRSNVTVSGTQGKTILKKADGVVSPLALDGDFGEQQITVADANGFAVGHGVAIWDDRAGGFHTTVARITGSKGNTFAIDKPLMADCLVDRNAKAATVFPVISGYDVTGVTIENLVIDGNQSGNVHLNGCRGGGIFLYRGFGTVIRSCTVKDYNGDGFSFQQSNDVTVSRCISEGNAQLGFHPGSGSQRPKVIDCVARDNGTDGLFLCWRVRHGVFQGNLLEANGRFGISIGHKDTDNLIERNLVMENEQDGIFFRNESFSMAAHRNRLRDNTIKDNGMSGSGAGIRIRGETDGLVLEGNRIADTRKGDGKTQKVGILIEESVGSVLLKDNKIEADTVVLDRRTEAKK